MEKPVGFIFSHASQLNGMEFGVVMCSGWTFLHYLWVRCVELGEIGVLLQTASKKLHCWHACGCFEPICFKLTKAVDSTELYILIRLCYVDSRSGKCNIFCAIINIQGR